MEPVSTSVAISVTVTTAIQSVALFLAYGTAALGAIYILGSGNPIPVVANALSFDPNLDQDLEATRTSVNFTRSLLQDMNLGALHLQQILPDVLPHASPELRLSIIRGIMCLSALIERAAFETVGE
jgi:hypothetical protein